MDPSEYIANRFEKLLDEVGGESAHLLPDYDRAIYHLICIRCEIDINSFDDVFGQLLSEDELLFAIRALEQIESHALAEAFRKVHTKLRSIGFYRSNISGREKYSLLEGGVLDKFGEAIVKDQELWKIDAKLLELIPVVER